MERYGLHFTGVPGAVDAEFLAGGMFELERVNPRPCSRNYGGEGRVSPT
jgi:hypothetical protein